MSTPQIGEVVICDLKGNDRVSLPEYGGLEGQFNPVGSLFHLWEAGRIVSLDPLIVDGIPGDDIAKRRKELEYCIRQYAAMHSYKFDDVVRNTSLPMVEQYHHLTML